MFKSDLGIRFGAVIGTIILLGGCSAAASTPSVSTRATASSAATPGASGVQGGGANLVVLADGVDGGLGLWALSAGSKWVALAATPGATALGGTADGIAVAAGHDVDLRPGSDLSHAGTVRMLKWSSQAPTAPVVSVDGSPSGKLAIVSADEKSLQYALAAADGTVTVVTPAPNQSFTALVAWLDEARLLALTTDTAQVSRLAVMDTSAHSMNASAALGGVRVFAVSSDRQVMAAATERAVYAGPVTTFLGQTSPQEMVALDEAQVVWALALDAGGSRVFMLSGTVAADGTVGSIHELGYARQGAGWVEVLDVAVPFSRALGQVCLV